jgi:hypothetical protein
MQVVLETDEAWSLMSVVTSFVIDRAGLSADGKAAVKRWRSDRAVGTMVMDALAEAVNEALGTYLDEKTRRMVRRRGRYVSSKETAR